MIQHIELSWHSYVYLVKYNDYFILRSLFLQNQWELQENTLAEEA